MQEHGVTQIWTHNFEPKFDGFPGVFRESWCAEFLRKYIREITCNEVG